MRDMDPRIPALYFWKEPRTLYNHGISVKTLMRSRPKACPGNWVPGPDELDGKILQTD